MYLCVRACENVCAHTCAYTCMWPYVCVCVYACTCARANLCVYVLSSGSFDAFRILSRYVRSALVTQTQPHKRSHITASVLIGFTNITQLRWQRERACINGGFMRFFVCYFVIVFAVCLDLSSCSFYALGLPSRYVSTALVTQTHQHKRIHMIASVLIPFINIKQPHW